jgi:hypothetical protein
MARPAFELTGIFRQHGAAYREQPARAREQYEMACTSREASAGMAAKSGRAAALDCPDNHLSDTTAVTRFWLEAWTLGRQRRPVPKVRG